MSVNIEALVDLEGYKIDADSLAKGVKEETGLAAIIANGGTGNRTDAPKAYRIIVRGTSENDEKAWRLLKELRSMMRKYGKNGNHPVVVASSVDQTTHETQSKYPSPHAYSTRQRPYHRRRGTQ